MHSLRPQRECVGLQKGEEVHSALRPRRLRALLDPWAGAWGSQCPLPQEAVSNGPSFPGRGQSPGKGPGPVTFWVYQESHLGPGEGDPDPPGPSPGTRPGLLSCPHLLFAFPTSAFSLLCRPRFLALCWFKTTHIDIYSRVVLEVRGLKAALRG